MAKRPTTFEAYGAHWPQSVRLYQVIVKLIQSGGSMVDPQGKRFGAPLWILYRDLQSQLWPTEDHHDWSDLMLRNFIENRITVVQGSKDCSKTHTMAKFALTDYFCFPQETLIMMTSTDVRGLELRVWGDLKDLFMRAKDVWPDLPGNPLSTLHGIFTDNVEETGDVRDVRKGLICLPCFSSSGTWSGMEKMCFPAGTPVLTPNGYAPIETIKIGDSVIGAFGEDRVCQTFKRSAHEMVRIYFRDGRTVDCTPNHPFLTQHGWVNAVDILNHHYVLSPHDPVQNVRQAIRGTLSDEVLLHAMPKRSWSQAMQEVWKAFCSGAREANAVLLKVLQFDLELVSAGNQSKSQGQSESCCCWDRHFQGASIQSCGHEAPIRNDEAKASSVWKRLFHQKVLDHAKAAWRKSLQDIWKWNASNKARMLVHAPVSRSQIQSYRSLASKAFGRLSALLQAGFQLAGNQVGCGNRWRTTHQNDWKGKGSKKGGGSCGAWVDRVEILESRSGIQSKLGEGNREVYNLQVEKHPSYVVNGFIVHNCGIKQKRRRLLGDEVQLMELPYLTTLANLDKGDFKGVFVGNPIGEEDPLDKLAEPEEGWDSLGDIPKTTTWRNRYGGITINLVGTDSPAIRYPGRYPYLINQSDIDRIKKYWGENSAEYWNQAMGVRRPGVSMRRVVTRDMAMKFGAQDPVVWGTQPTTKVYALDAAYGGDRCVAIHGEFGKDINGKLILSLTEPRIVPIRMYPKGTPEEERMLPEDQIAEYVKSDCERLGIPAAHVFHDATGRGSLGSAFARLWRHDTNPVEFGGTATPRPVRSDLYIYDEKLKQRRLKRCDEHYSKKVTELWFSIRHIIEAGQMRNLPNSVLSELCVREWKRTRGDRIELETKMETKDRLGRSPDLADACAVLVEGARRLGFQIANLEPESKADTEPDDVWKRQLEHRAQRLKQSYSLTYA